MGLFDGILGDAALEEPEEDRTVTLTGFWTPEFQKALDDMHRLFDGEEGASP